MKKLILLAMGIMVMTLPSLAQKIDRSKRPPAGPAPELKIGSSEKFTLENGLTVFFVEDRRTPTVRFSLSLAKRDPIYEGEKAGYISLSGDLMRRGTTNRTKDDIDEDLDYIGARFFNSSSSMTGITLVKYTDKMLDIMTDILLNPTFPEDELQKLIKQYKAGLASNRRDPQAMLSMMKDNVLYGKDHPYGERTTEFTLDKVTIKDCKDYYKTYWRPNISYLVIVGDLSLEEAKAKAEKYFSSWEKGDVPSNEVKPAKKIEKGFVGFVNKDNAKQSVLNIANTIDFEPYSKDYAKGMIMNSILGGSGFNTRLFQNLREDKGYTYGAYSSLDADRHIGEFSCGANVRNDVTDSALTQFMYELNRIRSSEVTDKELDMAKKIAAGSFAIGLENPGTSASFATITDRYGLPDNYFESYIKRMNDVSKEEVLEAAKEYIQPEKMVFAVAGNGEEVKEDLEKWAKANNLDFKRFDPEDGEEIIPVDPTVPSDMTAEKVVARYIQEIGGTDNIKKIKTLIINASNYSSGSEVELNEIRKIPGKLATSMMREGEMVYQKTYNSVVDKGFYNYQDREKQSFRRSLYDASKELAKKEAIFFDEIYFDYLGYKIKLGKKTEVIQNEVCYEVRITTSEGNRFTKYYSKRTGLLMGFKDHNKDMYIYDKYKWVEGVKMPFYLKYTTELGPIDVRVTSIKVNETISDDYFKVDN